MTRFDWIARVLVSSKTEISHFCERLNPNSKSDCVVYFLPTADADWLLWSVACLFHSLVAGCASTLCFHSQTSIMVTKTIYSPAYPWKTVTYQLIFLWAWMCFSFWCVIRQMSCNHVQELCHSLITCDIHEHTAMEVSSLGVLMCLLRLWIFVTYNIVVGFACSSLYQISYVYADGDSKNRMSITALYFVFQHSRLWFAFFFYLSLFSLCLKVVLFWVFLCVFMCVWKR